MALGGNSGGNAGGVKAGRAYVELAAKDSLTASLKGLTAKFKQLGSTILGLSGIGGAVAGVLGGLSFKETVDDLARMNTVGQAFGITGRQASGLFGVLGAVGGVFKENIEGIVQFSGTMDKAFKGVGQGAELFDGLSITAKELNGLSVDEQFYRVLGAIRQLPQGLQQSKLALLGGTDSLKQWQRLLTMSEADVRQMAKGFERSSAELDQATEASRAMQMAGAAVTRAWQSLVIIVAPIVTQVATALADALAPIAEYLADRELIDLWDELLARLMIGWEQLKFAAESAWIDVKASAKLAFIDLVDWVDEITRTEFWAGLVASAGAAMTVIGNEFKSWIAGLAAQAGTVFARIAQAAANPAAAGAILAGMMSPLNDVSNEMNRMLADFLVQSVRTYVGGAEVVRADAAAEKAAARGGLNAAEQRLRDIEQRVQDRRAARRWAELMEQPIGAAASRAAAVGRSLGTFGAGSFLSQGFGRMAADNPAKQMVNEQKKTNMKLGDVVNAVRESIPRFL